MTTHVDVRIMDLETIAALLSDAEEELRPAHLRTVCRMRTNDERAIADLIAAGRVAVADARARLATLTRRET